MTFFYRLQEFSRVIVRSSSTPADSITIVVPDFGSPIGGVSAARYSTKQKAYRMTERHDVKYTIYPYEDGKEYEERTYG